MMQPRWTMPRTQTVERPSNRRALRRGAYILFGRQVATQHVRFIVRASCSYRILLAGLASFALLLAATGCASRRLAPVLVEHQVASARTHSSDRDLNFKLVTYNIWGLPSWMTGAPKGRYPKIERELERLDAHFILLQEAWTAKSRTAIPRRGPWAIARAAGQHTLFQQCGLVTLSKFPIVGGQFYPFTRAMFPDRLVNKGVLKTTVQLPDGELLNIWNAHLQDAGAERTRARQVAELLAHVQAANDGQIADLVAGDFNCTPDSPLYAKLAESLGQDLQQITGATPFVTWDKLSAKPAAGKTLDYVFLRPRISLQVRGTDTELAFSAPSLKQRLSDHLGLETSVSLAPGTALAGAPGLELPSPLPRLILARAHSSTAH